jgi:hypothetical protein
VQIQTQERSDVHDLRQQVHVAARSPHCAVSLPAMRGATGLNCFSLGAVPQLQQAEAVSAEYRERKGALSSKLRR